MQLQSLCYYLSNYDMLTIRCPDNLIITSKGDSSEYGFSNLVPNVDVSTEYPALFRETSVVSFLKEHDGSCDWFLDKQCFYSD